MKDTVRPTSTGAKANSTLLPHLSLGNKPLFTHKIYGYKIFMLLNFKKLEPNLTFLVCNMSYLFMSSYTSEPGHFTR